mmetsp:Transcript_3321/g.10905  ORF Transcript_3321/g.10905 Transcript_3321/m.10905 type:complete len:488 (-) Transcript_3321:12-1475(-)
MVSPVKMKDEGTALGESRATQAASPIALVLVDLLADPSSTLHRLLCTSDLFCFRMTCKVAWATIHHRPLTKRGVLEVASADHHVPLLRWALQHDLLAYTTNDSVLWAIGETGDADLVGDCLSVVGDSTAALTSLLGGAAQGGHDQLALSLLGKTVSSHGHFLHGPQFKRAVAAGGAIATAKAVDGDRWTWLRYLPAALSRGRVAFSLWILSEVWPNDTDSYMEQAASSGSTELVTSLHKRGWEVTSHAFDKAVASGSVDLLNWMTAHEVTPFADPMKSAARRGHVHVMEWLLDHGYACTSNELLPAAVETGTVATVRWLMQHDAPHNADELAAPSCRNAHGASVFEFLVDECECRCDAIACMEVAAENPAFDAAILTRRFHVPLHAQYLLHAIGSSRIERVRFALSQHVDVPMTAFKSAIDTRDTSILSEILSTRQKNGNIAQEDKDAIDHAVNEVHSNGVQLHQTVLNLLSQYGYNYPSLAKKMVN